VIDAAPPREETVTRVSTSDGIFAVEINEKSGKAQFCVDGADVEPDAFIASVLVEWFDRLFSTKTKTKTKETKK
jgi:hypothetical protein